MNRHLIYTNGRSGSNALVSLLNQHPNIVNYGELLGSWTLPGRYILPLFRGANGPARYLDWAYEAKLPFVGAQTLSFLSRTRQGRNTHFRIRRNIVSLGVKDFAINFRR